MKIGIMSYWNTEHNYGQVLQCFAMQQFLRNLGHEPFHIRYVPGAKPLRRKLTEFAKIILNGHLYSWFRLKKEEKSAEIDAIALRLNACQAADTLQNPRKFGEFKERYLNLSQKDYCFETLVDDYPRADAYIAGSDQIWAYPDNGYFLDFGDKNTLKIAYAPSFGGIEVNNALTASRYRNLLKNFNVLTVRESGGIDLCRGLGFNDVVKVPDPSFLLEADDYREITSRLNFPDKDEYILLYLLGNPIDIATEEIFDWAKKNNIGVKYVTAQGRTDEFPKIYPNVDEWMGLIDNAKYVITNSFHGMAMSIIFNKRFMVIPVSGSFSRMNGRIFDTLKHFDLNDRIYKDSFDSITSYIDYSRVNSILESDRATIKNYFKEWLSASNDKSDD